MLSQVNIKPSFPTLVSYRRQWPVARIHTRIIFPLISVNCLMSITNDFSENNYGGEINGRLFLVFVYAIQA